MRRTAALAPLSRDHHVALVVARGLVRAEEGGTREALERFVAFMAEHGLDHFVLEEALLVPAARDDPHPQPLIGRMLEDHGYLRGEWRRLRTLTDDPPVEQLHEIGARLERHVRMEERELFPYLEASLPEPVLTEIGRQIELGVQAVDDPPAVRLVRRFLDAFLARDIDALCAASDAEVAIRPLRLTGRSGYQGHAGLQTWLDDLARAPVAPDFDVEELEPLDAVRVAVRVRVSVNAEPVRAIALFVLADGCVREVQGYFSDEEMLRLIGAF